MKITRGKLESLSACKSAIDYFNNHKPIELKECIKQLLSKKVQNDVERKYFDENSIEWANWLLPRCMKHKQFVKYAVYAAELVLPIFEKKYPKDDRPRKAIEAAKKVIKRNTKTNRNTAYAAAYADAAAYAADAAAYAAYASADAYAAYRAAYAAYAAAYRAAYAAYAAYVAAAADADRNKTLIKIIRYGLRIIEKG
jgi:hypothetical protein